MPPSLQQKLAIDQELLNAIRLIQAGFGQLQNLDAANDFYHLPLLTLSSGFERFMKVILCLRILEKTGEFPGRKDNRKLTPSDHPILTPPVNGNIPGRG